MSKSLRIILIVMGVVFVLAIAVAVGSYVAYHSTRESNRMATEKQKEAKDNLQKMLDAEKTKAEEEANAPDTIPPKIQSSCSSILMKYDTIKKNEERVCIKIDSWNGYLDSVNSVPITGKIEGDIKSITVDGKNITWDENKQIYQRINLYIYGGLNKYKVVAEDMSGNKSTGYVETDAQNTDNDIDVNLNQ